MHSCLDAKESTKAAAGVVEVTEEVVNTVSPGTITAENHDSFVTFVRKAFGHFGLFAVSGLISPLAIYLLIGLFRGSKYYQMIIIALEFGLLMGLLTETIQLSVGGRSGELTDVLIDYGGYIIGFLIVFLILFLIIHKKHKKHQTAK